MAPEDRRPHQIVPVVTQLASGTSWSSCYPNGELRYVGPRAKKGYRHGRVYPVSARYGSYPPPHPLHARHGQITVYDLRYGESTTKGAPDKHYPNFEAFCREWENPE